MWWDRAVVYQIYPRSFMDSNGDGIGDLPGIESRLDHIAELGADALWLSPIYPSPQADFGYDVADYEAIDPVYGTLEDFDRLLAAAHDRGLRLLMDLVPCHTSIEHRWWREHPDWYIRADGRDGGPPNNWLSAFGGPAWSPDGNGRWYLHSFYPEQPDLDWRNPEVHEAFTGAMRFWLDRGVDGFRLDAIDRLLKDRELRDEQPNSSGEPFGLPLQEAEIKFELSRSRNPPDIADALRVLRQAAGDALLVGEVYLPSHKLGPYLEHMDACFAFELYHSPWDAESLRRAIEGLTEVAHPAWVLSNHDFPRLVSRFGPENARAAATLLMTLPGLAFVYQGEEIGMANGPGTQPPLDRAGRDAYRHPMQWNAHGGFTDGRPWLPYTDPELHNVEDQRVDPRSLLSHYRELIALRRELGPGLRIVDDAPGVVAYARGDHLIRINTTAEPAAGLAPHEASIERNASFA